MNKIGKHKLCFIKNMFKRSNFKNFELKDYLENNIFILNKSWQVIKAQ